MKNEFLFCPLGGTGEIGMNMNLYGYGHPGNHKWIIVDMGVTFADDSIPGIDLIYPDPGFIIDKKDSLLGIVLTHAHEDHIGAITQIWPQLKCKIYATPFTAVLISEKFKEKKIDIEPFLITVQLNGNIILGPFEIDLITLTHSTLEPNGLKIKSPLGNVLHTGDWKCDPEPLLGKKTDSDKLKKIGDEGVLTMICDSTNVNTIGRSGSEGSVRKSILKIIERLKKRVVVTTFASNVARMETIFYCAKKTGRQISLVGRSMHKIYNAAKKCGYLDNIIKPVDPRDAKKISREKIIYLCTGSQGEPMGAMSRISSNTHPDVLLEKGDTAIFSSKIIPGNEKKLSKLHNKLVIEGVDVITEEDEFVHVSGHPNRDDLKDMYEWIRPKSVIPVHGEHKHIIEHISFAKEMNVPNPLLVKNGDIVKIAPNNKPVVFDKAPTGRLFIDGSVSVYEDSKSIKERKNISINGMMEITILINSSGDIYDKPIISVKGLPIENHEEFKSELEVEIKKTARTFKLNSSLQEKNAIEAIKGVCRKLSKQRIGKRPYTNINFVNV
tara:strand:+ start:985 stop:2643 length:1659 start_codon:yes stop_codon:yes gene_type:complete